jgi:hypothetical protein
MEIWAFVALPAWNLEFHGRICGSHEMPVEIGEKYRRRDIYRIIGIPEDTKGCNWDTGYNRHEDDCLSLPMLVSLDVQDIITITNLSGMIYLM